ncbi:MAG: NUDIX hydrolase [Pyrinomonadaceae bacterium]
MARRHGPWTIEASERKYDGELIRLDEDQVVKPDGSEGTYATVRMKDGAAVLAVDGGGTAYFAREFRYALGRENVEVVGGGINEGESPRDAARRELREELGIEAEEFVELGAVEYATSLLRSSSTLFLALRLRFTEKDEDPSEEIETVKMSLDEAAARALSGDFVHATTALLVLRARHYLERESKR